VILRLLLPLLAIAYLSGCNNQPAGQPGSDPLQRSSAVSVSMPEFVTTEDTTLSWRSDLIWVDDPQGRFERRGQILQQSLQAEFERKGYQFSSAGDTPDYDVVAVVLLGELQDHAEIQEIFRLYPSLANPASGYGKGTVMAAIATHGTSDIVWRGALEVFTDPSMQPVNARDERLGWISKKLLGSIPEV